MSAPFHKTEILDDDAVEKQTGVEVEVATTRRSQEKPGDEIVDSDFTPEDWKRIKRQIDRRLVVTCGVLYVISVMDRNNVGAAAIAGLTVDLELNVGYRYVSSNFNLSIHSSLTHYGIVHCCVDLFRDLLCLPSPGNSSLSGHWAPILPCGHNSSFWIRHCTGYLLAISPSISVFRKVC